MTDFNKHNLDRGMDRIHLHNSNAYGRGGLGRGHQFLGEAIGELVDPRFSIFLSYVWYRGSYMGVVGLGLTSSIHPS
jgi:hypothetical protein